MDQAKLDELKVLLTQRREDLQHLMVRNEELLREQLSPDPDSNPIDANHQADAVQGDSDFEKDIQIIRRERAELALVSSALARIEMGAFGECEDCGTEINFERLKAIPYTRYCVSCKEASESDSQSTAGAVSTSNDSHSLGNIG